MGGCKANQVWGSGVGRSLGHNVQSCEKVSSLPFSLASIRSTIYTVMYESVSVLTQNRKASKQNDPPESVTSSSLRNTCRRAGQSILTWRKTFHTNNIPFGPGPSSLHGHCQMVPRSVSAHHRHCWHAWRPLIPRFFLPLAPTRSQTLRSSACKGCVQRVPFESDERRQKRARQQKQRAAGCRTERSRTGCFTPLSRGMKQPVRVLEQILGRKAVTELSDWPCVLGRIHSFPPAQIYRVSVKKCTLV